MSDSISHRGPDSSGVWTDERAGVGFVHRRLAIIDLSPKGHQPMWDATGRACIVYNGEIYNFIELRRELVASGFVFNSECDTEVILNLFLRDGVNCVRRLNGIFAFAIWDVASQSIFMARDGLGIKPLYYAETGVGFVFASELKAIMRCNEVSSELDNFSVGAYLTFLYAPSPHTMLKAVKKLRPGFALRIADGRIVEEWSYYELPYDQPIASMSVDEAIGQAQYFLRNAVRQQMVADVPIGAFLSGGLDSSSVVAFAREFSGSQKFTCFSIGLGANPRGPDGGGEDLPYAKRVAYHLGVKLEVVTVGPCSANELEEMVYQLDEPQADPAALNTLYICRLARQRGIKVLLSGAGGDDIFTGYRRHRALSLEKYWSWMPQANRMLLKKWTGFIPKSGVLGRRLSKAFQFADLEGNRRIAGYFQWLSPERLEALMSRHGEVNPSQLMEDAVAALSPSVPPLNRMLYLDTKYFLPDHNLNYTDKMAMATGVEVRVPLLDNRLVAFAARLPLNFKQRGQVGKWIFKRAMESYLPSDVIYRPKAGFGVPLRDWVQGGFIRVLSDYLSPDAVRRRGLFDYSEVTKLIEADRSGKVDAAYPILALACIEIWLRKFVDGRGR